MSMEEDTGMKGDDDDTNSQMQIKPLHDRHSQHRKTCHRHFGPPCTTRKHDHGDDENG
jgi:hypothetical protein